MRKVIAAALLAALCTAVHAAEIRVLSAGAVLKLLASPAGKAAFAAGGVE